MERGVSHLTITCIQAEIVPGDSARNTRCAQDWLARCERVSEHPHLVLFPEYFLQGLTEDAAELAEPLLGPFGRAMVECAKEHDVFMFAGFLETSPDPARPYNSIGVWGPDGAVGAYHKTHLYDWGEGHPDWKREAKAFLPGDELGLFEIAGARVGVMTCADGLVVEVPRTLAVMGADIILYPNGREEVPPEHAEYHLHAGGVPIAVCNGWGSVGPETMRGGSRIIRTDDDPVSAGATGPAIITATFDVVRLREQRREYWPLSARRPELYRGLSRTHAEWVVEKEKGP